MICPVDVGQGHSASSLSRVIPTTNIKTIVCTPHHANLCGALQPLLARGYFIDTQNTAFIPSAPFPWPLTTTGITLAGGLNRYCSFTLLCHQLNTFSSFNSEPHRCQAINHNLHVCIPFVQNIKSRNLYTSHRDRTRLLFCPCYGR
jgi:hypothetical protein